MAAMPEFAKPPVVETPRVVENTAPPARYLVPRGKTLATARGELTAGQEVLPQDVEGGEDELNQLVQAGALWRG